MSSQLIASAESVVRRAPVGMLEVTTGMREGAAGGTRLSLHGDRMQLSVGNDPPFLYR